MKFKDKNNGKERDLEIIIGCDYWADKEGSIYCCDTHTGYCWDEVPADALRAILQRKILLNGELTEEQHLDCLRLIMQKRKALTWEGINSI